MKKYKYIRFIELISQTEKSIWSCRNNRSNEELGIVEWYPLWKRYCYFPKRQAVYSAGCLDDISDFIKREMEERKEETP